MWPQEVGVALFGDGAFMCHRALNQTWPPEVQNTPGPFALGDLQKDFTADFKASRSSLESRKAGGNTRNPGHTVGRCLHVRGQSLEAASGFEGDLYRLYSKAGKDESPLVPAMYERTKRV